MAKNAVAVIDEDGQITEAMEQARAISPADLTGDGLSGAFSTSLDLSTIESRIDAFNMLGKAKALADNEDVVIDLIGWTAQNVRINDTESGKMVDRVMLGLVDRSGQMYTTVSTGMFGRFQQLLGFLGQPGTPEWPKAVKIKSTLRRTGRDNRTVRDFEIVDVAK